MVSVQVFNQFAYRDKSYWCLCAFLGIASTVEIIWLGAEVNKYKKNFTSSGSKEMGGNPADHFHISNSKIALPKYQA
jgi:hypothetical protein